MASIVDDKDPKEDLMVASPVVQAQDLQDLQNGTTEAETLATQDHQKLNNVKTPEEEEEVSQLEEFIKDSAANSTAVETNSSLTTNSIVRQESKSAPGEESTQTEATTKVNGETDTFDSKKKIVLLFTGQGAQWKGMGESLLSASSNGLFSKSIHASSAKLKSLGCAWDLVTALKKDSDFDIDVPSTAIPLTIATQVALVDLLRGSGVKGDVVLGHSTGEIAAAYAANLVSHEDAISIAYNLGMSLSENGCLRGTGKMLAIGLPEGNVEICVGRLTSGKVEVACVNSPRNTTVAGDSVAIDELRVALEEAGVFCRDLKIATAYHSQHMEAIREDYGAKLKPVLHKSTTEVEFYSTVTGSCMSELQHSHWVDSIISKVDYSAALEAVLGDHAADEILLIEIGPQPHLRRPTLEILESSRYVDVSFEYYATFKQGTDAVTSITELSRKLSHHGVTLNAGHADTTNGIITETNGHEIKKNGENIPENSARALIQPPFLKLDRNLLEIYQELVDQLSVLLSIAPGALETSLADCGFDSYLAAQFEGWVNRKYEASISIQQILDSKSVILLALLILKTGTDIKLPNGHTANPLQQVSLIKETQGDGERISAEVKIDQETTKNAQLPKIPLPDLEDTLEGYYNSIEAFGTPEELAHTRKAIEEFKQPEWGLKLQKRLQARVDDPNLDCWMADLYNSTNFLNRKGPLVPFSSFFYTHKVTPQQHGQAERAAVVTSAVADYKELLDNGLVKPAELNGQPTCMYLFSYLFNTSRLPLVGNDVMERFPGNNHIVVFRKGRAFKVDLYKDGIRVSYEKLKKIFEWILRTVDSRAINVGVLTSDNRNVWAKNRQILKEIPANVHYLHTVEASAFIVCLDDASPEGAPQRARHLHFGDGGNRWNDKSIQFVICENGISGIVGEHSMLDAGTVLGLDSHVSKAIFDHRSGDAATSDSPDSSSEVEELHIEVPVEIQAEIARMEEDFQSHIAGITHAFSDFREFGASLPQQYKCPSKSFFQLVVILASRYHFGFKTPLWETVSLGNFHKGRVEINQVVRPCTVELCDIIDDPNVPMARKKELFQESIRAHTNSVMRSVRGRGVDRHLSALWMAKREDEEVPAFFADPMYMRTRPRKIMSHCHPTAMAEKGFLLRDPIAVWVHYEVEEESVFFSVTGVEDAPAAFCKLIDRAARALRGVLEYQESS